MQLQDIHIYPIKSLGGVRVSEAQVEIRGFQFDRRWMLVDENGRFLSQRTLHELALLQVIIESQGLKIMHKQQPELLHWIPFEPQTNNFIPVTVWDDTVIGQLVSPESNDWFSRALGIPCRLVRMPLSTKRHIEEKHAVNQETVSFADAMPFLIIGQKSLDDLNGKLIVPVPMNRFRPNLVFSGGEAFEEDKWEKVKIGECLFKITKPCGRCVVTTVDQETAITGKDPLKTLAQYRTVGKKVLFGQNMIALTTGTVKVGDVVQEVW
ncbi:MAG: MOSC N-terminal beta barrel domain-containing protein [Anditalea sp.]